MSKKANFIRIFSNTYSVRMMNGYRGEWREVRGKRNADKRRKIIECIKIVKTGGNLWGRYITIGGYHKVKKNDDLYTSKKKPRLKITNYDKSES